MNRPRPRGRFIAGAVCPRCGAADRLMLDVETGERRWCVECDFDEAMDAVGGGDTSGNAQSGRAEASPAVADRARRDGVDVVRVIEVGQPDSPRETK